MQQLTNWKTILNLTFGTKCVHMYYTFWKSLSFVSNNVYTYIHDVNMVIHTIDHTAYSDLRRVLPTVVAINYYVTLSMIVALYLRKHWKAPSKSLCPFYLRRVTGVIACISNCINDVLWDVFYYPLSNIKVGEVKTWLNKHTPQCPCPNFIVGLADPFAQGGAWSSRAIVALIPLTMFSSNSKFNEGL